MSFDGRAVANFILDRCDARGRVVTPFALQKIIYFCHAWSLVTLKRPLIRHSFEAWEHGPVLPYLYRDFKEFENRPITKRAVGVDRATGEKRPEPYDFSGETAIALENAVDFYSRLSFSELYSRAHVQNGPWDRVWHHNGTANPGMKIDNSAIAEFYSQAPLSN